MYALSYYHFILLSLGTHYWLSPISRDAGLGFPQFQCIFNCKNLKIVIQIPQSYIFLAENFGQIPNFPWFLRNYENVSPLIIMHYLLEIQIAKYCIIQIF